MYQKEKGVIEREGADNYCALLGPTCPKQPTILSRVASRETLVRDIGASKNHASPTTRCEITCEAQAASASEMSREREAKLAK